MIIVMIVMVKPTAFFFLCFFFLFYFSSNNLNDGNDSGRGQNKTCLRRLRIQYSTTRSNAIATQYNPTDARLTLAHKYMYIYISACTKKIFTGLVNIIDSPEDTYKLKNIILTKARRRSIIIMYLKLRSNRNNRRQKKS